MRDLKPILVSLIVGGQNKKLLAGRRRREQREVTCLLDLIKLRRKASPHLGPKLIKSVYILIILVLEEETSLQCLPELDLT